MNQQYSSSLNQARQFLRTVLQQVSQYQGNAQQIYPIWAQYPERFNQTLLEAISVETSLLSGADQKIQLNVSSLLFQFSGLIKSFSYGDRAINLELAIVALYNILPVISKEFFPNEWAATVSNLAVAYCDRIRGERAENLEQTIELYRQALQVYTREQFPVYWALTASNLASAYLSRIRGERAENLERAIELSQQALQVYTREQFPVDWAATVNNLAGAYSERIRGERAENLERAIDMYQQSLQVHTREQFPVYWARIVSNLARSYSERIRGERAENLERAIELHQQSLQVHTREQFPVDWALTASNLASAYLSRIRGERAENLEQAIDMYQQSLQVYTREQFPVYWARIVSNLARSYYERIRGERAENLERAIDMYQQSLQVHTREQFPVDWAVTVNNLASAYSRRIRGERPENLEQAIELYRQALQVYTREQFPVDWAQIVSNLASAYLSRIRGERAENLERAIELHQQALQVHTREQFPVDWARIVSNLAVAYYERIRGERAENLEQAIELHQQALQVHTREQFPVDWARTVGCLALAYYERIRGERAENLEQAIELHQQALQVHTREQFPVDWARTVDCLALAYYERIRGERAENLERAIELSQQSLQVYTREQFPVDWAVTVNNLALAYSARIRGERAENLERAIELYQQALQVRTREQFPVDWATTVNNLALAYLSRIRGERAENLEQAIELYRQSLQVRTREQFPVDWAATASNLAAAYFNRIHGEQAENLEQAIELYRQALQVRTREQFPVDWARTAGNLAAAYFNRIHGERAENLEQAIELYRQALQVHTPDNFPNDCYITGRSLGDIGFFEGDWEVALEGYAIAIEASERSRSWATNETSRQEIHAEAVSVYMKMVQACINTGRLNLALETVERSRSKRLVELMSINDFYQDRDTPNQVQSYLQEYETLQRQIDGLRLDLRIISESKLVGAESSMRSRAAWGAVGQHIQELEQQKQTMRQQISRLDPVSAGLLEVRALNLIELQQLIDRPNTALLSFYNTADSTYIFVLRQNQLTYHPCLGQGDTLLSWLNDQWLLPYLGIQLADDGAIQRLPRSSWKPNLPDLLAELSQRLQLEELIQNHLQAIDELILIPHFGLHQIPFAALPTTQGTLGDRFTLRVVPSCQVLQFCHQRPTLKPSLLGMIEDASGDLPCSTFEAESVATLYNVSPELRLRGPREATVGNYKYFLRERQIQMLLSCHHAQSRLDNPLESKLVLGDGDITLGELLSPAWRLPQLADVFLSCCETGLGRALDPTDDVLTLATGFLCAGARSVISTLWSVDDLATAILSILYHQNRHKMHGNMNRPQALQRAQQTLREMTGSTLDQAYRPKLEAMLNVKYDEADNNRRQATTEQERKYWAGVAIPIGDTLDRLENLCAQPYPFEHPIYWAGFVCHGLR